MKIKQVNIHQSNIMFNKEDDKNRLTNEESRMKNNKKAAIYIQTDRHGQAYLITHDGKTN